MKDLLAPGGPRGAFVHACLIASALSVGLAAACNPTGGVPIELTLSFEGLGPAAFTTASGWDVELTEARAILAPIYAYAPDDEVAALMLAIAPSRAFAHGGHSPLDGRLVRAELLEPRVIDALDANASDVATVGGFEGPVDALTLVLAPADGDLAVGNGPTHGHTVWIAGVATRDGIEVAFEGGLDLQDEALQRVEGVAVDGALTEAGRLIVGADARAWLREADFTEGGAVTEGSQPHRALYLGARSAASWNARTEE